MARREARELTHEEFDTWRAATDKVGAVAKAADEEGGPSLSLVPKPERGEVWPTDLLPPAEPDPDAETGSVHLAAASARLTARSAYRLRARSPAFAAAWDTADQLAVGRLSAIAFDRAINGRTEQVWHEGELVAEKRLPSDKLLMWLLARLDPRRFAAPWELRHDGAPDPQAAARESFPAQLEALADTAS